MALSFRSGLRLIYKPRDVGPEDALQRLLSWCNRQSLSLELRTVRVLDLGTHGWMELVEQRPCADAAAARRFYRRAGMLLGVLSPFGASDCHRENVVASGEDLVLIDAEVLLNQEAATWGEPQAGAMDAAGHRQLWDSVLRTGLLPRWQLSPDQRTAYDISGLGSVEPQPAPTPMPRWRAINTDDMHRAHEPFEMPALENVPTLEGRPLRPEEYAAEVIEGFAELYRLLMDRREALLTSPDLAPVLAGCRPRFLPRDTQVYGVVLRQALAPTCLVDGARHGIELEALARAFLVAGERPVAWPLLRAEIAALERMDIPHFSSTVSSDALTGDVDPPIDHFFERAAGDELRERLARLDEADLALQCRIIRDSFVARTARPGTDEPVPFEPGRMEPSVVTPPLPAARESLIREAIAIAERLESSAVRGADGSVNWIDLQLLPAAGRLQLQPLGASLYDGCCGVVLFLAALERMTGDSRFHDLIDGALHSLRGLLRIPDEALVRRAARRLGLGGMTGLGSIVYALVRSARLLDDDELLADALRAADLITPDLVAADEHLDVMSGSAGALLGLLAVHGETGERSVLERATLCGRLLLARRVVTGEGTRAWQTMGDRPLTGFSHGAAGIAYALLRLGAVTSDDAFVAAASEGIGYERSVFSSAVGNWPDLRPTALGREPTFVVRWCHGAAGIGLARLGGIELLDTDEVRQDVDAALAATHRCDGHDVDHLCCGNFGRIELLLQGGQKLRRPELNETATRMAAWSMARAGRVGAYRLDGELGGAQSPSLFRGTAGIGYQLLRLAAPDTLPSALLME
jgi:type 2 lantibiotic biosynthesis protein LanM